MLTIDEIADELAHISYKPGWKLIAYQHQHEGIWLSILAEVPDVAWPSRTTVLNIRTAIPPIPSMEYLRTWLLWRLLRVESHECREFLRHDGQPLDDPHRPDANH
jgi:hypothetical protein